VIQHIKTGELGFTGLFYWIMCGIQKVLVIQLLPMRTRESLSMMLAAVLLINLTVVACGPKPLPELDIPGNKGITELEVGDRLGAFKVDVDYLGKRYECQLKLNIDSAGNWVVPQSDEAFTVVLGDEKGQVLTRENQEIGEIPLVFIGKFRSGATYRVGKPGQSQKPVSIETGTVNFISIDANTLIRGVEGLRVTVEVEGAEVASGMLPLSVMLDGGAVLDVTDVQTRTLTGQGLIHIYSGEHKIFKGTNTIQRTARAAGVDLIKVSGNYYANRDNTFVAISESTVTRVGETVHEILLQGLEPDRVFGNPLTPEGDIIVAANDSLLLIPEDGTPKPLNFNIDERVTVTGHHIISDGRMYDTRTDEIGIAYDYDFLIGDYGILINKDGGLSMFNLDTKGDTPGWETRGDIPANSAFHKVDENIFFITNGMDSTNFIDIRNGFISENGEEFVETNFISMSSSDGKFVMPDGYMVTVEGVFGLNPKGENVWSREPGQVSRVDSRTVKIVESDGYNRIYETKSGIEIASWTADANANIAYTSSEKTVMNIEDAMLIVLRKPTETME